MFPRLQQFGVDLVPTRIRGSEISEMDRLSSDNCWMIIEPRFQRRQILAPVDRAIGQMRVAAARSTGDLIKIGEIVWSNRERLADLPNEKDPNRAGEDYALARLNQTDHGRRSND